MNADFYIWALGVSGITGIGTAFLVKTLVKSGIEETVKSNFAKHLEDYKSQLNREVEALKISLKNSETFFSRQLEALTKLRRILRHLPPKKQTKYMEWDEACEEIAKSFCKHADGLDEFLCNHEAVLPNDVLQKLEAAISIATEGSFELDFNQRNVPTPSRKGIDSADQFYNMVKDAVCTLQNVVNSQVNGRHT